MLPTAGDRQKQYTACPSGPCENETCSACSSSYNRLKEEQNTIMDDDTKRRLVYGLLSLVLGAIATRLAMYLTNRILGEPEDGVV